MPKARTGTVVHRPDENRWRGAATLLDGSRRWVSGGTEEEVRQKITAITGYAPRPWSASKIKGVREGRVAIILAMLDRARTHKWSDRRLAEVLSHGLTPKRIRYRVSGPCVYCGDELASTVDHPIPLSRGGIEGLPNVVSSCLACNISKGNRTPEEWPH